jgi:hypothetical protein
VSKLGSALQETAICRRNAILAPHQGGLTLKRRTSLLEHSDMALDLRGVRLKLAHPHSLDVEPTTDVPANSGIVLFRSLVAT